MKIKLVLLASQLFIVTTLMASGTQGGTPPLMTAEDVPTAITLLPNRGFEKAPFGEDRMEQLVGNVPSRDLIRTPLGRTLIPLSSESIRRLNVRTSTGTDALIKTDSGESFRVRPVDHRLIDPMRAAEVVEKGFRAMTLVE